MKTTNTIIICGDELTKANFSGIPRYVYEIVKRIDEKIGEKKYDIELCYPNGKTIYIDGLKNIKVLPIEATNRFRTKDLAKYAKKKGALLVIMSPTMCTYANSIIAIHDARPLEKGNNDGLKYRLIQKFIKYSLFVHRQSQIVTVSNFQKNRISKLYGVGLERISVIGNGWEHIKNVDSENALEKYPKLRNKPYFYAVGSMAKHKNYEWIIEISKRYSNYNFVIAGAISKKEWKYDVSNVSLDNVFFLGFVSDELSKSLMENCVALLQPSKYEGFGIPPLEALALGKKIIVSNATCLPEIYGESAVYFDPDDINFDLENALKMQTKGADDILLEHSWENSAQKWVELIEKRLSKN